MNGCSGDPPSTSLRNEFLKGFVNRAVLSEVSKIREQFLDVPVPRLIEHLVDVPKIVVQDRIQQLTFQQFADIPALQEVEVPVFKVFTQDRVQQRFVEQNIANSRCSRAADDRAVGRSAKDGVSKMNPATDCRADR